MKKLIFVLSFLSSASVLAAGAQSYNLNCKSANAEISFTTSVSDADGFSVDDVRFKRAGKLDYAIANVIMNADQYGSKPQSKFAFFLGEKLYSLTLPQGALFAAMDGKTRAKIAIDGVVESATCVGTRQY